MRQGSNVSIRAITTDTTYTSNTTLGTLSKQFRPFIQNRIPIYDWGNEFVSLLDIQTNGIISVTSDIKNKNLRAFGSYFANYEFIK